MKSKKSSGYTLIELMLVVTILAILASIATPRFDLFTQKAWQATTKGNLGAIRSTLSIYYTDMEGRFPMAGHSPGFPAIDEALAISLAPKYIERLPTPKLLERLGTFNGLSLSYDGEAAQWMAQSPPRDVVIVYGPAGPTPMINRPFVYDPDTGLLYLCNGNYDLTGQRFYEW